MIDPPASQEPERIRCLPQRVRIEAHFRLTDRRIDSRSKIIQIQRPLLAIGPSAELDPQRAVFAVDLGELHRAVGVVHDPATPAAVTSIVEPKRPRKPSNEGCAGRRQNVARLPLRQGADLAEIARCSRKQGVARASASTMLVNDRPAAENPLRSAAPAA